MRKRCSKWMADWYDEFGVRKRKAFKTQRSAAAFQRRMREQVHASKKAQASRASANSSRLGENAPKTLGRLESRPGLRQSSGRPDARQPHGGHSQHAHGRVDSKALHRANALPQTLYGKRKYLRRILLHLEACGGSHTPLAQLAKIKRPRPRGIIATPHELAALRKAAAPWEACWLEIAAGHGLRFAEAKRLAAIHYNAELGTITYPTKGHDYNQLPVTPELKNFFDTAPQDTDPHRPLLERLAGTHLSKGMMYSAWHRLLKRAGANPKLIPHDLRRTLADRVYTETKDLRMAQQILGHRDLATTTMYLEHKHPEDVRGLLDALSQGKPYVPQPRRGAYQN